MPHQNVNQTVQYFNSIKDYHTAICIKYRNNAVFISIPLRIISVQAYDPHLYWLRNSISIPLRIIIREVRARCSECLADFNSIKDYPAFALPRSASRTRDFNSIKDYQRKYRYLSESIIIFNFNSIKDYPPPGSTLVIGWNINFNSIKDYQGLISINNNAFINTYFNSIKDYHKERKVVTYLSILNISIPLRIISLM